MKAVLAWLATSPWASWFQAFTAIVIAGAIADWATAGSIHWSDWQAWVIAALVATLKPLLVAVNPADPRWGRGADDAPDA